MALENNALEEQEDEQVVIDEFPPVENRQAPIGADNDDDDDELLKLHQIRVEDCKNKTWKATHDDSEDRNVIMKKLAQMEKEQDQLNNSLISMTSHFAKVQFRLRQIVEAPSDKKEDLLNELEKFAFLAIPDTLSTTAARSNEPNNCILSSIIDVEKEENKRQSLLIDKLRLELEELENYAFVSGHFDVPSNLLLKRQGIILDQLQQKLNLKVEHNIRRNLTEEQLKEKIDSAIDEIIHPIKLKNNLVTQLQAQINDLEMFISHLQATTSTTCVSFNCSRCDSSSMKNSEFVRGAKIMYQTMLKKIIAMFNREMRAAVTSTDRKVDSLTQIKSRHFQPNTMKYTSSDNHYGDLRARLELTVDRLLQTCSLDKMKGVPDSMDQKYPLRSKKITYFVRKDLAVAIKDLMQHGLIQHTRSGFSKNVILGCLRGGMRENSGVQELYHAWDVICYYYYMKHGVAFNEKTSLKLSNSFALILSNDDERCDDTAANNKIKRRRNNLQLFLVTVGKILSTHSPYKRSADAQFKAFICAALNHRKLIVWLKFILHNQAVLEFCYQPWSYTAKTKFDDAFQTLEKLFEYHYDLPVDTAIRQFKNIQNAF